VLTDSWFSLQDNFEFITARGKHFISALKDKRLVALSRPDKKQGRFTRVDELQITEHGVVRGWLKGFPTFVKQKSIVVNRVAIDHDI
jgi:hypothetical protein